MTVVEDSVTAGERRTHERKTVLLLDDDANTLLVLHAVLERTDARVIECEDEGCAVQWCEDSLQSIDLLVSDVVLKQTNGPAVVKRVSRSQPLMRLLFISGFSLPELERRGLLHRDEMAPGRVEFLQKPFSPAQFLTSVENLLIENRL